MTFSSYENEQKQTAEYSMNVKRSFLRQDLLHKSSIILVELCQENTLTFSDIYNCLNTCGGHAIMVESPTYFQAFNPGNNKIC